MHCALVQSIYNKSNNSSSALLQCIYKTFHCTTCVADLRRAHTCLGRLSLAYMPLACICARCLCVCQRQSVCVKDSVCVSKTECVIRVCRRMFVCERENTKINKISQILVIFISNPHFHPFRDFRMVACSRPRAASRRLQAKGEKSCKPRGQPRILGFTVNLGLGK